MAPPAKLAHPPFIPDFGGKGERGYSVMLTCIFWAEAMSRGLGFAAGQGRLIQRRASWGGPIASRVSRPGSRFIRVLRVGGLLPVGRSLALQPELGLITRGVVERLRAFGGIAVV